MSTTLSGAKLVTSNSDPTPVTKPASGSDGTYTWAPVGQKGNVITFSVTGKAASPTASTNVLTASVTTANGLTNYVQVTAAFTSPQDQNNWTIQAGSKSGTTVKFVKGTGGVGKPRVSKASISRK
ncbi:MAG: hypothetical protein ABI432_15905 [Flavobacteriales bacterium]